jgi:hypothetical protein
MLQTLRGKAQALRLGGSKQLRACMGGSKSYMPDKQQCVQRRILELNHAARKNGRDYICEKVDLESAFRKKTLGYSSPSGWGNVYMANLSMLRSGTNLPGATISLLKQAHIASYNQTELGFAGIRHASASSMGDGPRLPNHRATTFIRDY